jgi:hypothetical protein
MPKLLRYSARAGIRTGLIGVLLGLAVLPLIGGLGASAGALKIQIADPSLKSDGTMSGAARQMLRYGPLPADPAALAAAKAAADRAYEQAVRSGRLRRTGAESAPSRAPGVIGGINFEGVFDPNVTPSDSTGAVGPTRYIETINDKFAIYNKTSSTPIATGTLTDLWDSGAAITTDPQVIWDPRTKRFYYAGLIIVSDSDNRLTFGFSKNASPNSAADFCKFFIPYGTALPDYPKLGDSTNFAVIGVNTFNSNSASAVFIGSDLVAISKPAAGTTCPITFKVGEKFDLRDTGNNEVFTPIPGNEIDDVAAGYVIARNLALPSTKLWLFRVTKDGTTGDPVFGPAKGITVSSYTVPASARQGGLTQVLDTLDARNMQGIIARNPDRGNKLSFWTEHTIKNGTVSAVRWYEIDPVGATVLRFGNVVRSGNFLYNAAISPDRQVDGSTKQFGNSFVIEYSESSAVNNINPRIVMVSSVAGGAVNGPVVVKNAGGPYQDFHCPNPGDLCRWGDYSATTPDPRPAGTGRGNVWLTNQFASGGTSTLQSNWHTEIARVRP